MGNVKSHALEKIQNLVTETLEDGYASLAAHSSYKHLIRVRDLELDRYYLWSRLAEEGITFATTMLPKFGEFVDAFVRGDEVERVEGFKPYDGLFPVFLRPFWFLFKDIRAGQSDQQSLEIYRIIRSLLLGLKKLELPFEEDAVEKKLQAFLEIERFLEDFEVIPTPSIHRAQLVMEQFCEGYIPTCENPQHGPGAVAGGERHNGKWLWSHLYESLHAEWPYWDYLYPVRSAIGHGRALPLQLAACAREYKNLVRTKTPTARLLFVPKDSRGPRVISCEPKELMYVQQGVSKHLMHCIETHRLTKGHVNFVDQTVNGNLARLGSLTREWDTIDLSDASDRVSCALVRYLVPERVFRKWAALRSTHTALPNGQTVELRKFAPMGSALCFPVESLVFWSLCVGTIWESSGDLELALESVYVYGDDIIIKNGYTNEVIKTLHDVGLSVNLDKCFVGSVPFRESCGIDAFNGVDVTPFRVKKLPPSRPTDGDGLVAWVKYAENSQSIAPRRSKYMLETVEGILRTRIPRVPFPQPFLSIVTDRDVWSIKDYPSPVWDPESSYYKARLLVISSKRIDSPLSEWKRLQKALKEQILHDPSVVVDRASTQIRRKSAKITYVGRD